jgi:HSP20 family protein
MREESDSQRPPARQSESRGLRRWDPAYGASMNPFDWMDQMFDQMAHGLGFPRVSGLGRFPSSGLGRTGTWSPRIETLQKGDTFVVRAELPGLRKDDVNVEVTDDAIMIRGERRNEHEEEREGYWRSEREYGEFVRTIPLPDGVIAENPQAAFRDGVLEITMPCAPRSAGKARRVEIRDATGEKR